MESIKPIAEQRKEALLRRANKFIEWLHRPDYTLYVDENSITHLAKLIDLIVWALENSLPLEEWRLFRRDFIAARNIVIEIVKDEEREKENYNTAIPAVVATLRAYLVYMNK